MYLLVGLGNPGSQYNHTRHNIGFAFVDWFVCAHAGNLTQSKWKAEVGKTFFQGEQIVTVKPTTFMNLSGEAVGPLATFYKLTSEEVIVVHDDLDLPVGRIKFTFDRGAGGHKGIASLIKHLGSKRFYRIRVGVGRPQNVHIETKNFVLSPFSNQERHVIESRFADIEQGLERFILDGSAAAMNFLNIVKE